MKDYDHVTVYKAYHKYIWNVSRIDQYKISLRRDGCNNIMYQLILNANTDLLSDYIYIYTYICIYVYIYMYICIHKLIITASSGIFKKVNIKKNSSMKQMPTNAWIDSEGHELRKTINTNAKHQLLPQLMKQLQTHDSKKKKHNYNTNLKLNHEEMCSNNPKDYWYFWKRLQQHLPVKIKVQNA